MPLKIKSLSIENAQELSEIAMRAYFQHYSNHWLDDGKWYAHKSFNIKQLQDELADKKNLFFMAIHEEIPVGFLKLRPENQLKTQVGEGFEIERIYLTKAVQGKGIGKALMNFSIGMARQQQKDYVWLKTMDTSDAKDFYKKMGFQICDASQLDFELMKPEVRGMFTMKKSLKSEI